MIKQHGFMVDTVNPKFDGTIESLQAYIAEMSSAVRDKSPKDNEKLWNRLMKESYGDKPSSVFKFIPCTIDWIYALDIFDMKQDQMFGFKGYSKQEQNLKYHTNARELLNWGWTWEQILPTVDFTHYRAFKGMTMYKVYQQLRTHSVPHWISHSQRYTESSHGYWYPDEYPEYLKSQGETEDLNFQSMWDYDVENSTPNKLKKFMKDTLGINRREIYALGSDMLQKRVFSGGGYLNNENDLPHLLRQRFLDPHTQLETRQWAQMLADELGITKQDLGVTDA